MIGTTPGVIKVPKGAVFIRVTAMERSSSATLTIVQNTRLGHALKDSACGIFLLNFFSGKKIINFLFFLLGAGVQKSTLCKALLEIQSKLS